MNVKAKPQNRPRLWIVTPELHRRGGTERCLAEQVERWKGAFDIRLYAMEVEGVDLEGVDVQHVRRLPGPHLTRWLYWYRRNQRQRRRDVRRLGAPDAVYTPGGNCPDADAYTVHIVFTKHWEYVRDATMHDLRRPRTFLRSLHRILYWKIVHRLEPKIYGSTAALAALSHRDATYLEEHFGHPAGSVEVIPHGVDAVGFHPDRIARHRAKARAQAGLADDRFVVLLFGNDFHKKGIDTALRAMPHLPAHIVLAVRVDFDPANMLALVKELGIADRVVILPRPEDVIDCFAVADVLIAPSREDAFSMPPMEAMACGIPTIVSAELGFTELVSPGVDAVVLADPNDAEALAAHIRDVAGSHTLRTQLVTAGLALARSLSWDENARRTADMIRAAIATRADARR